MLEKILLDDIFKTDSTDNDKEYLDEKCFGTNIIFLKFPYNHGDS